MSMLVNANGRRWRYSPGTPPLEAGLLRAVALAHLVDDMTLAPPPRAALSVSSDAPPFSGCAGPDGLVGLIGSPSRMVPPAQIAGMPVAFTVSAAGYIPLLLAGAIGAQPGYPAAWSALDLGLWRLQRNALTISGRVTRLAGGVLLPVAGVSIKVTAATPVRALAGALPAPPSLASFTALATLTDAQGRFSLPLARALSVTLTATQGAASASRTLCPDYAEPVLPLDFRLS
ncbi:carboxypeptidase-like regulatory domain-containing protein [Massilia sp. BJB1822]|uniref:carboxypeptidase-like regulatory domain-containing protein n=1 Tax=Massilia sp. BJB1822 TaxID=2744470 RepID=UPI0015930675|nr:carboxypeptidase-like regulatory domain-containing protein [Massilia sp. BJB1822]NVD97962.1 carboxypeptidase regulatory-like domain-containing protein [Massilia sp. BJB1822]